MRVLMTTDTVGGVWTYATELAAALSARDVDVVLATMGAPLSTSQQTEASRIPRVSIEESAFRLEWMANPWTDVDAAGEWLLDLERRYRPDVVHLNGYAHAALGWSAPTIVVGHSCVRSWHEAVRGAPAGAEWDEYTRRVTAGLERAHAVVAPSRYMRDALVRHYGVRREMRVIYNARSAAAFAPAEKESFVFAAGRVWDVGKNLRLLDAAAATIVWQVFAAGPTESPDGHTYFASAMQTLGVLAPADVRSWLARACIFAHPARYEPFGLSVLEAAMCGCALVLGDIATLRELWTGAAVFVDPTNDEALARAVNDLCGNPSRCISLGARARARARHFTPARMAAAYLGLYADVLARTVDPEVMACAS